MIRNASDNVIGISEKNPHYFRYKGKEILLLTTAEHYGAVISKTFDYTRYFDALAAYGLNYTRIYPGGFVEYAGKWMPDDNMAPGPDLIVPWARSDVPGYKNGGNKFDLDRWDPEYFARLRDFLGEAEKRGIIIEICFFNCQFEDYWPNSPLHKDANIQGVGDCEATACQTLDNEALVREQLKYIEKLIIETNGFDNVIYEFVDESSSHPIHTHKIFHWISKMIDTAVAAEEKLPKKHLLAQQLEIGVDFCADDRIGLIVTQYIKLIGRQVGGVPALDNCYDHGKPIEINETAYINSWIKDDAYDLVAISRLEAWEFMVGGGAAFNQLNGYFNVPNPSGESAANRKVMQGLRNLRTFLEGFDYVKMTRDRRLVRSVLNGKRSVPFGASVNAISEKGRQHAIYIHHSFPDIGGGSWYEPNFGDYEPVIRIAPDAGEYRVSYVEPASLKVLKEEIIICDGAGIELVCPAYTLDLAIKIISV